METTFEKFIQKPRTTNVPFKTLLFLIGLKMTIIVDTIFVIVVFGANLCDIMVILTNITIEMPFSSYSYGCNCILHCIQFDSVSRKLIKFDKNYFLWCIIYFIRRVYIKYGLVLIVVVTHIKNEMLYKSGNYNLCPLLIVELRKTRIIPQKQELPQIQSFSDVNKNI